MNGTWQTIDVGGKPADVYTPPGGRPRFGVLDLHPVSGETLSGNATFSRLFDEFRLVCVCPHGKRSWWADRVCAEFDPVEPATKFLRNQVLAYFAATWNLVPPAIALTGRGMGGQGALRLAFQHPQTFPVVAALGASIEYHEWYGRGTPIDDMYDSKEQCRQDTALLHVHPAHHPPHLFFAANAGDGEWYRGNDRLHEKLAALGVEHTCDLTTRADGEALAERAMRFVNAGLEAMSRRLM